MTTGITAGKISETPIAVIDFETTGFTPGYDRVVEVSVVRIDPGESPKLVFDTLVHPGRAVAATEIHGITDDDVKKAPRFQEIAGELVASLKGCVISAYNAYFDMKFLNFELSNLGLAHEPPFFCLMYMRPMLGIGPRCKLDEACRMHAIDYDESHIASCDAMAGAKLYVEYLNEIRRLSIGTFAELADLRSYKFNESFTSLPFSDPADFGLRRSSQVLSRAGINAPVDPLRKAFSSYWESLRTVIADLEITDDELALMAEERARGGLSEEQIRVLHAGAFASVMAQFGSDRWIDDRETNRLRRLGDCLAKLGWAPGR